MHYHHGCGCEHHNHMGRSHYHHEGCGCTRHQPPTGHHGYIPRRFPTKEEIIEELGEYLKQLQAEVKGVEERLAELGKKKDSQ